MKRLILFMALLFTAVASFGAPSAGASASCGMDDYLFAASLANGSVDTDFTAHCSTKWQVHIVLLYKDATGWHNMQCDGGFCRRLKPNDGSFFGAGTTHEASDHWNPVVPGDVCAHPMKLRWNFAFQSQPGVTIESNVDNDPCHI